jgi:hypothetical protein
VHCNKPRCKTERTIDIIQAIIIRSGKKTVRQGEVNFTSFVSWMHLILIFTPVWFYTAWYGHVQRMAEGRLPRIALKWMPKQRRTQESPTKNWMEVIRKTMNERNLNEGQCEDKKQ